MRHLSAEGAGYYAVTKENEHEAHLRAPYGETREQRENKAKKQVDTEVMQVIRESVRTPVCTHLYDLSTGRVRGVGEDMTHMNVRMSWLIRNLLPNPFSVGLEVVQGRHVVHREYMFGAT